MVMCKLSQDITIKKNRVKSNKADDPNETHIKDTTPL